MSTDATDTETSPLSASDNLDVIGERKRGGVDMLIVTTGPLDASETKRRNLDEKLSAYLCAAVHENFANLYPAARGGRIRMVVSDKHSISDRARHVVESFAARALMRNVEVWVG